MEVDLRGAELKPLTDLVSVGTRKGRHNLLLPEFGAIEKLYVQTQKKNQNKTNKERNVSIGAPQKTANPLLSELLISFTLKHGKGIRCLSPPTWHQSLNAHLHSTSPSPPGSPSQTPPLLTPPPLHNLAHPQAGQEDGDLGRKQTSNTADSKGPNEKACKHVRKQTFLILG